MEVKERVRTFEVQKVNLAVVVDWDTSEVGCEARRVVEHDFFSGFLADTEKAWDFVRGCGAEDECGSYDVAAGQLCGVAVADDVDALGLGEDTDPNAAAELEGHLGEELECFHGDVAVFDGAEANRIVFAVLKSNGSSFCLFYGNLLYLTHSGVLGSRFQAASALSLSSLRSLGHYRESWWSWIR